MGWAPELCDITTMWNLSGTQIYRNLDAPEGRSLVFHTWWNPFLAVSGAFFCICFSPLRLSVPQSEWPGIQARVGLLLGGYMHRSLLKWEQGEHQVSSETPWVHTYSGNFADNVSSSCKGHRNDVKKGKMWIWDKPITRLLVVSSPWLGLSQVCKDFPKGDIRCVKYHFSMWPSEMFLFST